MERKEAMLETGCSRFFWAVLVILLCAAPSAWAADITEPIPGPYYSAVDEVVNVYADITYGLVANIGSKVNIYAGAIGDGQNFGIEVSSGTPSPVITVYGTNFSDSSGPISTDQWDPTGAGGNVLTVTYTDDNGNPNGEPVNLLFDCDIPINLVNTAVSDPAQLIQALIDKVASFNLHQGIDNSLDAKLDAALNALDDVNANNDAAAINTLQAFINAVEAQRDNKITSEQADVLIADAQAIIDLLST